jgi:WD40 repeat protein
VLDGLLTGHPQAVTAMAFSRDGKVLVSGDVDGSAAFWDAVERRRLGPVMPAHGGLTDGVGAIDAVSDVRVVSASEEDRIEWIVGAGEWAKIACGLVTRPLTALEIRQYLGSNRSPRDPCSGSGTSRRWWRRFIPSLPGR